MEVAFQDIAAIEANRLYIVEGRESAFLGWHEQLLQSKDWADLSAVRANKVYILRQRGISNNAYTLEWQLGEVERLLAAPNAERTSDSLIAS